jgi:pilus assembly protein CpaF
MGSLIVVVAGEDKEQMMQNAPKDEIQTLSNALLDVTDQVYHSLSLFEQLASRLEARCHKIDADAPPTSIVHEVQPIAGITPNYRAIAPLIADSSVNDILINSYKQVYVERAGVLQPTDLQFESEEELMTLATEIAHFCGRMLDGEHPLVDARLPDGSRVNIVIPPAALDGVSISIRKFGEGRHNLEVMAANGCMTTMMADFLKCCAQANVNIIIAGGTGAGKTTLLNAICRNIPDTERVVTIEDSAELQLPIPHVVRLEAIAHQKKGVIQVSIRDLVKNSLRMRPNRIVVGEVRGVEAFDMIQAMNTGHEGSLTTVHANTPRDVIARVETMVGMAGLGLPTVVIRKQIASAVNIIVQAERSSGGKRYVKQIAEVVGMEGDVITMQDIFTAKEERQADGSVKVVHAWSGTYPRHAKLNKILRDTGVMSAIPQ